MKKLFLVFIALTFLAVNSQAQFQTPAPSPGAKLTTMVGLTEVTVEYSRPGVKDRVVFGGEEALEKNGSTWRVGANAATKISFDKEVKVGDTDLKAGSYAILAKLGASEWTVMFFPYESSSFGSYLEKEPAAKVTSKVEKNGRKVESFTIDINNLRNNSATIDLMWDKTLVSVPLTVHSDKQVMASFEALMAGPSDNQYYNMGAYLASTGENLDKALTYVQKVSKGANAMPWHMHTEAQILAQMGKYKDAIMVAEKSKTKAQEIKNEAYVSLNEKAIAEWKKK